MSKVKTNKTNNKIEVTFSLNGEEWAGFISDSKKDLYGKLELKGFRPGKVPENIAKQNISQDDIRNEALNKAIDANFDEINTEIFKEEVISRPVLEVIKVTDSELEVKFTSALMPELKIGDLSKINIKYEEEKVSDDEIEKEMAEINKGFSKNVKLDDKAEIKDGHTVNLDFNGKVDGVEFDGGKSEGFDLLIGSKSFIDNFEDQLVGHKINEEFIVSVKFPETYPAENLKGKKAEFDIKINSISEKGELSKEEASKKLETMGFKSIEDLKERVSKMALEQKEQKAKDAYFDLYIEEILKLADTNVEVPDELIKQEIESDIKNFENQLSQQGMKLNDYLKMIKATKEEFVEKNIAINSKKKIVSGLVYTQLLKDFKVNITEADVEKELTKIAKDNNLTLEQVKTQIPVENVKSGITFNELIKKIK